MKNKIQSGHVLTIARSSSSVSGIPYDLGSGLIGVSAAVALANAKSDYAISGVKEFDKRIADVYAVGDIIDWDNGNDETVVDGDAASDFELGICVEAIAGIAGKVKVLVNGNPGPGPSYS